MAKTLRKAQICCSGQKITGKYRRSGYTVATDISIVVSAVVSLPDSRGRKREYMFGINQDGTAVLLVPGGFDGRRTTIEDSNEELLSLDGWYSARGLDAFGFADKVSSEDVQWALDLGALPLVDYQIEETVIW